MAKNNSGHKALIAAKDFSRRTLFKGAVAGVIAAATPFIVRRSLASSGEINVFAWGDYIQDNIKDAFEKKTGIKEIGRASCRERV